jgi:hypothetical protein
VKHEIIMRDVETLIPYARNARTHSPAQVAQIMGSIKEFGFTAPVLIHGNDILAGHGRVQAARGLGMAQVPTIDLSHLTKTQARAYILADNQLALNAGWEAEMLSLELAELKDEGFDLDLLGFDDLDGLMNPEEAPEPDVGIDKSKPGLFLNDQIIQEVIKTWPHPKDAAEVVAGIITPAMAMVQFNRLSQGGKDGYYISALWNPHRLTTDALGGGNFIDACADPKFQRVGARWMVEADRVTHPSHFIKGSTVGWAGRGQLVAEFRPEIARDIYMKFCKPGARVLDPCHGWGGRVIGWLAANLGGHYVGFDPGSQTSAGWREMVAFLGQSATTSTAENHCLPFEDSTLEPESFDFALTSPPYFDTEKYSDEKTNSLNMYKTIKAWTEGFYRPFILKTLDALKPGCVFLLNVGNKKYPLSDIAAQIAEDAGASVSKHEGAVIGRPDTTKTEEETNEDFLIIQKATR